MRNLIGFMLTALLGLGLLGQGAQAQVAVAPIEGATTRFTTPNPAAMQWGAPSRVGIYQENGTQKDKDLVTGKVSAIVAKTKETGAGGRYVHDRFALAGQSASYSWNSGDPNPDTRTDQDTDVAASLAVGNNVALGIGQQSTAVKIEKFNPGGNQKFNYDFTWQNIGASLAVTPFLYLGYVQQNEVQKFTDPANAANNTKYKRTNTTWGVGFRSAGKGGKVMAHVEYYATTTPNYTDTATSQAVLDTKESSANVVAEVVVNNILAGYKGTTITQPLQVTDTESTITLGWSPDHGLALSVYQTTGKNHDALNQKDVNRQSSGLALAMLF